MSRMYGRASLDAFSLDRSFGVENVPNPFDVGETPAPFDLSKANDAKNLAFANRFGLSAYAANANQLAAALQNPAKQLVDVNVGLGQITGRLSTIYENYVKSLRKHYLPEEVVFAKADAYIRPMLAAEMELLKLQFPYAVGSGSGGAFNPIVGLAEGRGVAGEDFAARGQFENWRSMKKAFKKRKKHRAEKKRRKSS